MSARCFVDTNLLVYRRDASEPQKQRGAQAWFEALWRQQCGRTGVQVLCEYYVTVTRKLDPGLPAAEAWLDVEDLFAWEPVAVDPAVMGLARTVSERFSLSWWDALIVAAAQTADCRYLLTEDLQGGQDLDGLLVLDPFEQAPEAVLSE